jgi:hypothetical protein
MHNKLETNSDYYHRLICAAEEAASHPNPGRSNQSLLRTKRRAGDEVTVEGMVKLLESVCDNPNHNPDNEALW